MSLKSLARVAAGAAIVAGAAGSPALADPVPTWSDAPTIADMAAAYPPRARAAHVSGHVQLTCEVGRDNHPRLCEPLVEKPGSYGFGAAARKLAEKLTVAEAGMVGQNIFVPVNFDAAVLTGAPNVKPTWASLPSVTDFQASFPKTENGVNRVRVVLGCTVEAGGALGDCAVAQEDPPGQGYGAGALALAPKFRVAPWGPDGEASIGAHIQVPIRYELTPVATAAAKP
ncbi:MAG: hypothetical protein ACHP9T_06115 [Caulobacterales bacterium]|jgi:hypothetical protein